MAFNRGAPLYRLMVALALFAAFGFILALPALAQGDDEEPVVDGDGNTITITLGSQRQHVDGNTHRFRQYVTPADGTYVREIDVVHPLDDHGLAFGATATDLLEPGAGGVAHLYDADLGLRVDSRYRSSDFYRGFYAGDPKLRRMDWASDLRWRISPDDHLMINYAVVDMNGALLDPSQNFTDERYNLVYHRNIGDYNAVGSLNYEQFRFAPGPYLGGHTTTWNLGVEPAHDGRTLFSGNAWSSNTNLNNGAGSPDNAGWALSAYHAVSEDLSVTGDLSYWEVEHSIANNAYATDEIVAGGEAEYTGLWRTDIRAGFETSEISYINGRHTAEVEPAVNTTSISLRSRPRRDLKIQADWRTRRVDDRPAAFDTSGWPVATRVWSESELTRIRLTYTPDFALAGITAGYRRHDRKNPQQGVSNDIISKDVSAWWVVRDDLTLNASWLDQDFDLDGIILPGAFQSESSCWTAGASWTVNEATSVDASYARAESYGAISLRQHTFNINVDHEWDSHKVRLGVTLDDLNDYRGTYLGYDADMIYAEFSTVLP